MKRVLMTGATGRLGRRVVPLLLQRGYQVRALLHKSPLPLDWSGEVESVGVDFTSSETLEHAFDGVDVVCHFAALMPPVPDDQVFRTNVEGTYRLLQAAAASPRKPRFVFASTDAVYCTGWSFGPYHAPITEETPLHPALFYGVSKVVGEDLCKHFQEIHQLPTVRLRFDWILEPREVLDLFVGPSYTEALVPEDRGKWDMPGMVKIPLEKSGEPFVEHVCDVRDSAQGAVLAVEHPAAPGHVFNIAGPAPFTYRAPGLELAQRLGVTSAEGRCQGIYSYEISNHQASSVLGYRPRYSVQDSLNDALAER